MDNTIQTMLVIAAVSVAAATTVVKARSDAGSPSCLEPIACHQVARLEGPMTPALPAGSAHAPAGF